ncbi:MAG: DUF1559 domain-containing protein [Verrucomicrobiota bacterium]|jgi:prepilin-type N-terminal cleavage/methylation domain-containing protein/prepilin-type processing-associated H-X9-DG protein
MTLAVSKTSQRSDKAGAVAFTLVEMLVVIAVIAILAALVLPALAAAKARAQTVICLNNTKQLALAAITYASDHDDSLPYNLVGQAAATNLQNWAAGVLDWDLTPDNTNVALLIQAALGPYLGKMAAVYHCPADYVLSQTQSLAGWKFRVRSYSMNASVGDAGSVSESGYNINNPGYVQFFKLTTISRPSDIFVFLDEHPDSISDGYFVNQVNEPSYATAYRPAAPNSWLRLPASYHNGAASFSFADGHAEIHEWLYGSTKLPPVAEAANFPIPIPANQIGDFGWLAQRMSVDR